MSLRRGVFFALLAALASGGASAQMSVYAQLSAGLNAASSVRTKTIDYNDGLDAFEGYLRANGKISPAAGFEAGYDGLAGGRLRLGASYDYVRASIKSIDIVGVLNGVPIDQTLSVDDAGDQLDAQLVASGHAALANAYVNLAPSRAPFSAYVGGGVGAAWFDGVSSELAAAGTAGIEFPLSNGLTAGLRYRYLRVGETADDLGAIEYEPIKAHLISLTLMGRHYY